MIRTAIATLILTSIAIGAQAQGDLGGEQADPWSVCIEDMTTPARMVKHSFGFVDDRKIAIRLTKKLSAFLTCDALGRKSKDPCSALLSLASVNTFDAGFTGKEEGDAVQMCRKMRTFAAFWWEVKSSKKSQKKFPACKKYFSEIQYPAPFVKVDAVIPQNKRSDPNNDGKFWNVCQWIADDFRSGRVTGCDAKDFNWFTDPNIPKDMWVGPCKQRLSMWVTGDGTPCDDFEGERIKYCKAEAALVKAFRRKQITGCPTGEFGVLRGVCSFALAGKNRSQMCGRLWEEVVGDFCTYRSEVPLDDLKARDPERKKGR